MDNRIVKQLLKDELKYKTRRNLLKEEIENWDEYYGKGKKDTFDCKKSEVQLIVNMLSGKISYISDLLHKYHY